MFDHNQLVHDFQQLHQRPSSQSLIEALQGLSISQQSWDIDPNKTAESPSSSAYSKHLYRNQCTLESRYLTTIISSSLSWIVDESARERIWELASLRLCERSGRTALPQITRTFKICKTITITLHEPSLTSDNLGLKTWASSYLLAKRLKYLQKPGRHAKVLELGAGTGLVGITAATVWGVKVHLTDLGDIVPNLERNVQANREMVELNGGGATTGVLDWEDAEEPDDDDKRYDFILASDPLYSPRHPMLLVMTICRWLKREGDNGTAARVVVELPLRDAYMGEVEEFQSRMTDKCFKIQDQGEEVGFDDWEDSGGGLAADDERRRQVKCWWGVWGK